jgi:hypothetical protein
VQARLGSGREAKYLKGRPVLSYTLEVHLGGTEFLSKAASIRHGEDHAEKGGFLFLPFVEFEKSRLSQGTYTTPQPHQLD